MSTHGVNKRFPKALARQWFSRNGQPVQAGFISHISNGLNHVAAYRKKELQRVATPLGSIASGSSGTTDRWYGYGRTGYGTDTLVFLIGVAEAETSATDPYVQVRVSAAGGGGTYTTADTVIRHGLTADTISDVPNRFSWQRIEYAVGENEIRDWLIQAVDYARPFAMIVFERGELPADDTGSGVVNPNVSALSPILDNREGGLLVAGTELWQRNASVITTWTRDVTSPTFTTTSYTNIIDGTSTTFATTNPHHEIQLTRHTTSSQSTVQVEIAVRAQATTQVGSIANNIVGLRSASGIELSVANINADGWYTATGTLPATSTPMELVCRTDASDVVRVDAVSVYEYEA